MSLITLQRPLNYHMTLDTKSKLRIIIMNNSYYHSTVFMNFRTYGDSVRVVEIWRMRMRVRADGGTARRARPAERALPVDDQRQLWKFSESGVSIGLPPVLDN